MPSQLLINQEFPDDDQDKPANDVDCAFANPLPCAIDIMSLNPTGHHSHGFTAPTSGSNNVLGFWHIPDTLYDSDQNYDRGTGVGHPSLPAMGANSLSYIDESTPHNGYQWQNIPSPSAVESSQVIFASQPNSITSHSPSPPLHCRWIREGIHCTFAFGGTLEELRLHCRAVHFVGPKNMPIKCQWEDCVYSKRGDRTVHVMRRDCIWRHTCEKHLALKRGA